EERTTLAEALRDRGYRTAAFAANFSYLYRSFGVAQGFGHYDDAPGLLFHVRPHVVHFVQRFAPGFCLKPFRSAREINAAALAWLDGAPAGRPAFLFVNYMEPHEPWLAEPPYDRWSRGLAGAARLARTNLYTHAVHDFTDAERDFIAANYDGELLKADAALGELLAALRARGRYDNALVVVTADHGEFLGEHGQVGHIGRVLYDGPYKLITTSRGERLLFDLERDPEETDDLAARDPARTEALARRLDSAMSGMLLAAAGKN